MSGIINPGGGGSGTLTGPVSSTDNAIIRWDGTAGDTTQDSLVTISDTGAISGVVQLSMTGPFSVVDTAAATTTENIVSLLPQQSGTLTDASTDPVSIGCVRTHTGGTTITDDFDVLTIARTYLNSGGGTITANGSVLKISTTLGNISGTLNGAFPLLEIANASSNTRGHINLTTDITAGSTADGDLFRTSAGLYYNFGGSEILLTGSSPSEFDATVGATGADYTTVSAALAASKTRLLIIDDVTESSACAVPSTGLYIYILKGKNLNMGANQFTFAGNYNLSFDLQDPSAKITWAFTAATNTRLFATGANATATVRIYGGTLDNNSTQSGCYVQDTGSIAIYENIAYEPPNVANCGIYLGNALSRVTTLNVATPGTTADNIVRTDAGIFRGVRMTGAFSNSNDPVTISGDAGMIDGITNNGNLKIAISGGKLNNVTQEGGTLNVDVDSNDQSQINNLFQTAGTVTIASGSNDNRFVNCDIAGLSFAAVSSVGQFVNCEIAGALTLTSSGSKFSNCDITGAVTVSGDGNMAYGTVFGSTLTINSGADGNIFDGTFNGNVSNTGAQNTIKGRLNTGITLTLNSGATYSNIDVLIDQPVTDNSGNATNAIAYNEY